MAASKQKLGKSSHKRRTNSSKKMATTGTRGVGNVDPSNKSNKLHLGIGACLLLAAGTGVLLYVIFGTGATDCEKYLKGKDSAVDLDPISIRQCIEKNCDFDVRKCETQCPFGYERDEDTSCIIGCECAAKGIVQGDVSFDESALPDMLKDYGHVKERKEDFSLFFGWGGNLWKNNEQNGRFKIPYVLKSVPSDLIPEWETSVKNISERTCIDFVPRGYEMSHVVIDHSTAGCSSHVGRFWDGQTVSLGHGCFFEATIQHELNHLLGFNHEQTRPDRDAYVEIFYDNIAEQHVHNFDKVVASNYVDLKSEYDINSGMQYQSVFFAVDRSKPSIAKKGGGYIFFLSHEHFLTAEDFREINLLYNCPKTDKAKTGKWDDWGGWSECGETCGSGKRIRYRKCVAGDGALTTGCVGHPSSTEDCNVKACPPKTGTLLKWSPWSKCSKTCDRGYRIRSRSCSVRLNCEEGVYVEHEGCYESICGSGEVITTFTFGTWTSWVYQGDCSATCGTGEQTKVRECQYKGKRLAAFRCVDEADEGVIKVTDCNVQPCGGVLSSTSPPTSTSAPTSTSTPTSLPNPGPGPNPGGGSILKGTPGNKLSGVCVYGHILVGRFNKDEVPDLACIYADGFLRLFFTDPQKGIFGEKISWEGSTGLCAYDILLEAYNVHVVDVDGNDVDDLICENPVERHTQILLNTGGKFPQHGDYWRGFRSRCNWRSLFHDIDNDGRPDWVCGDMEGGVRYVYFGNSLR